MLNFDESRKDYHGLMDSVQFQYAITKPLKVEVCQMQGNFSVKKLHGITYGTVGDWLIRGVNGQLQICDAEVFKKTYDLSKLEPTVSNAKLQDLFGVRFDVDDDQIDAVFDYFSKDSVALGFVKGLHRIVDRVYEGKAKIGLDVFKDHEACELRSEATIYSGLPIDDEFDKKDALVFKEIKLTSIEAGFGCVIVSQG
jgi:hypothetical protein